MKSAEWKGHYLGLVETGQVLETSSQPGDMEPTALQKDMGTLVFHPSLKQFCQSLKVHVNLAFLIHVLSGNGNTLSDLETQ